MIETPSDWYYRSRNELLKSIIDGINIPNAVGDFHFAKMNLENHGIRIDATPMDEICDSLLKQAKKKRHRFDKKQKACSVLNEAQRCGLVTIRGKDV